MREQNFASQKRQLTSVYATVLFLVAMLAATSFFVQNIILSNNKFLHGVRENVLQQRAIAQEVIYHSRSLWIDSLHVLDRDHGDSTRARVENLLSDLEKDKLLLDVRFSDHVQQKPWILSEPTVDYYKKVNGLSSELDEFVRTIRLQIASFHGNLPTTVNQNDMKSIINRAESRLLVQYNTLTAISSVDSQRRMLIIRWVNYVTFVLIFVVLLLSGFFVFKPMVDRIIEREINHHHTNQRLLERASALEFSREKLRRQSQITNSILNTLSDALIVIDENKNLVLQNYAANHLFGLVAPGESLAQWPRNAELYKAELDGVLVPSKSPLDLALNNPQMTDFQVKIFYNKTSTSRIFSVSSRSIKDEENFTTGAVLAFHDISKLIDKEQELLDAKIKAETANVAKTHFLANISHEIRTPIAAILGFSERLLQFSQSPEQRQIMTSKVRRNACELLRIIDDLLDISKLDSGAIQVNRLRIDFGEVLNDALSLWRPKAKEKGLDFRLTFAGRIPLQIETDPVRLKQILANIIGNAIKFTEVGEIIVCCSLSSEQHSNSRHIEISVSDTGRGIQKHDLDKLFKPFAQVDNSSTRAFGGSGLGLSISRRLAHALGGDLLLTSTEYGKGSVFTIYFDPGNIEGTEDLKFTDASVLERSYSIINQDPVFFPSSGLEGLRILVVDDGEENRELVSFFLRHAKAEVVCAQDGEEALFLVKKESQFDLICLDIQMPKLDGYQTMAKLKEWQYAAPVIALTAHAMREEKDKCLAIGFTEHVAKPATAQKLVDVILKILGRHSQQNCSGQPTSALGEETVHDPIKSIIEKFRASLPDTFRSIKDAANAADLLTVRSLIHKTKGTAGACGLTAVYEELESIEKELDGPKSIDKHLGYVSQRIECIHQSIYA